ncbi:MAG TPA: diguanylate cyclase [Holophagaceae bacterium]|nr:diguanylate cyclase [Holophagaceae bacterium]
MFLSRLKRLILGSALAISAWASVAPAPAPRDQPSRAWGVFGFKSYGGDQGLTTLAVTVLAQDASGFVWVGTEDGLFRYDGENFRRFDGKDGLQDTFINALAAAPDGTLWVLTKKGLAYSKGGGFTPLSAASGLPKVDELVTMASSISCDAQSLLRVATLRGLYEGGVSGFWPVKGLPKGLVGCVSCSPWDDSVLAGGLEGEIYRRRHDGSWDQVRLPAPHDKGLVASVVQDRQGRIWARGDSFLVRYEPDLKAPPKDFSAQLPLKALRDPTLFADAQGRVWMPTQSGLGCLQGDEARLLDESWGLPDSWAGTALVDREGNLWVGSEGVHRVLGRLLWTSATRRQGLPSDTIWSIARTADGRMWAGTQAGVAVSGASGWELVPETRGQPANAILADAEGGLWAVGAAPGTTTTGAWHFPAGGRGSWVPFPGGRGDSLQCFSLAEDGVVWAISQNGGLWRIPKGGSPERTPIQGQDPNAGCFAIVARRGAVFIATDRGLLVSAGGVWTVLGPKDGLKSLNVQAMAMTPGGELWLSYGDTHGISVLKQESGRWAVAAQDIAVPALTEDGIVSMAFDSAGRLWLGTSRGVKRWDGQVCVRFGRGEGLPGEDADGNAVWADPDGMWFGMSNGLAHFDGRHGSGPEATPAVRILEVRDGGGHPLTPDGGLLQVAYPFRSMDFDYAALSFVNEGRVRLQIRLQGFEDQWRDTKFREARYTALPPGLYRFEVRAAHGDGVYGSPDTVDFRILAPWWRAWWFYGLCFVLVAALVLTSVRWRTAVLEHRNRQLEALVKARTLDLERVNEQLQESSMVDALTGLKNRRYLGMNLPEEESRVLRAFRTLQSTGRQPQGEDLVFLLVDLDYFKSVNDTHGHAAGDTVLKLAADAIRAATRDADTVARWGGEEFLVVARRADRHAADIIARKILDEVRSRVYPISGGQSLNLTCSVGFSAFPVVLAAPTAFGWEDVVEIADQCLYAAKRSGRDAFVGVYLDHPDVPAEVTSRILSDLPELVAEGKVAIRTSFDEGHPLDWKRGH